MHLNKEQLISRIAQCEDLSEPDLAEIAAILQRASGAVSPDGTPSRRMVMFDTHSYERRVFEQQNRGQLAVEYQAVPLNPDTAMLARGFPAVCCFVNDTVNAATVQRLQQCGVKLLALRCAGYNNVDISACRQAGIEVVRVPAYSPEAIAEHVIALVMTLNRKTARARERVRDGNFSLEGLVGFNLYGKTVGIIGTGKIGRCAVKIFLGFGCRVLAVDDRIDRELERTEGCKYVSFDEALRQSDIISLHVPLVSETHHLIDSRAIQMMKEGVMFINTSRGGLVDTRALLAGLRSGRIASAGLDVYEEEGTFAFHDHSERFLPEDYLAELLTFSNVLITSHQAFLTQEALQNIVVTTLENVAEFMVGRRGEELTNHVE